MALAALNRRSDDLLSEIGFRDEDIECAELLLQALVDAGGPAELEARGPDRSIAVPSGDQALEKAVEREMARAQRYHLGFSLSVFDLELSEEVLSEHLTHIRQLIERTSRGTDSVVWLSGGRLAILAPEEMRGQRALVRRFTAAIEDYLGSAVDIGPTRVSVRTATYPRDGETAAIILARCLDPPSPPTD